MKKILHFVQQKIQTNNINANLAKIFKEKCKKKKTKYANVSFFWFCKSENCIKYDMAVMIFENIREFETDCFLSIGMGTKTSRKLESQIASTHSQ